MGADGGIDWGHAEALAFGSLLTSGVSVRITGQDAERGTFSHRHAVLSDINTGVKYTPLAHLEHASALRWRFTILRFQKPRFLVSNTASVVVAEDTLVLWEAQFGDFVNVAQPIIDQFIVSDRVQSGDRIQAWYCCCRTAMKAPDQNIQARVPNVFCSCAPNAT